MATVYRLLFFACFKAAIVSAVSPDCDVKITGEIVIFQFFMIIEFITCININNLIGHKNLMNHAHVPCG